LRVVGADPGLSSGEPDAMAKSEKTFMILSVSRPATADSLLGQIAIHWNDFGPSDRLSGDLAA
jgi:hypothetical protein